MNNRQPKILAKLAKLDNKKTDEYLISLANELIADIKKSTDTDEIFGKLEMLEAFAYKAVKQIIEVVEVVESKSGLKPKILHKFPDYTLRGKEYDKLLEKCIELLTIIRYLAADKVLNLLLNFSRYKDVNIKSKSLKSLEELAKYNYFALQKIGFKVQVIILKEIEKWNQKKLSQDIEALLVIVKELLEPSFEGISWGADTMTFHSGPIRVNDVLVDIRKRTIQILEKAYSVVEAAPDKKKIIQALQCATYSHHHVNFVDIKDAKAMKQMIEDDAENVVGFYLKIMAKAENTTLLTIEEAAFSIRRQYGEKIKNIDKLYEAISVNKEYQIYRALVGYDYKLYNHRLRDDLDREASERQKKIQQCVQDIKENNLKVWIKRLSDIAKEFVVASDRSLYFNTMDFLCDIGKQKPKITIELLKAGKLEPFYPFLLRGLLESKSDKQARQFIINWADHGKYLREIAEIFLIEGIKVDVSILATLFEKAKAAKDSQALMTIARVAGYQYSPQNKELVKLFIAVIKELHKFEDGYRWADSVWHIRNDQLKTFFVKEADLILGSLLKVQNIDYDFEEKLAPIAVVYPKKIIAFFYERVGIRAKRKERDLIDSYSAVPYDFHILGKILREHEKIVVTELMKWYSTKGKEPWRFRWDASHLIKNIFPNFSPLFEREVIAHIKKGGDIGIVYDILQAQKGESYLWNIVREAVKKYHTGKKAKKIHGALFGYLSSTGTVTGEYGFSEAYKGKKKQLKKLSEGESDKYVKKFINEYGKYLDKLIVSYKKQADEEVALGKRGIF